MKLPVFVSVLILTACTHAAPTAKRGDAVQPPAAEIPEYEASPGVMNNARLEQFIRAIDENAEGSGGRWQFTVDGIILQVITDERADRMRIMSPIVKTDQLSKEELVRLMQANFDSALDARYAIANNTVWAAFIHPLSILGDEEFLTGVGQTMNIVSTYGTTFSSGLLVFGGGDSAELQKDVIDRLKALSGSI
ncbi:MAG: hypothetical protein COA42_08825 [Alteromonadaceae bacterium]|nr:MAG: hypothetical protein COA42_08825 [Alteromonadaceae bacterium]